jgi:hypothetical protein
MRTTFDIDDSLFVAAKKAAAERRVPLKRLVEEGLAAVLSARQDRDAARVREESAAYGPAPLVATLADLPRILGLGPTARVTVAVEGNACRVSPVDEDHVRARRGMLAGRGLLAELARSRAEERER